MNFNYVTRGQLLQETHKGFRMYFQSSCGWVYMHAYLIFKSWILLCALIWEYLRIASQLTSYTAKASKLRFFFFLQGSVSSPFFFFIDVSYNSYSNICFISVLPCFPGLSVNKPKGLQSMVWKKIAEGSAEISSHGPKSPVFSAGGRENISSSFNELITLAFINYLCPFSWKGSSWPILEKIEFNLCSVIIEKIFLVQFCFWESALRGKQSSFGAKWDVFTKQVSAFKLAWMTICLRKSLNF